MTNYQLAYLQATHDFSSLPFKYTQLHQIVKLTPFLSGQQCQLLFSNRYGQEDLHFERVAVANNPQMDNAVAVTFQGAWSLTLPRGSHLLPSDAIDFATKAGQPLYVEMTALQPQVYADFVCTYGTEWVNAAIARRVGCRPQLPGSWHARHGWLCLDGLNVLTTMHPRYLELTGDSLVETGMVAQTLFRRLVSDYPEQVVAINTGISGNRLLHNAPQDEPLFATYGEALLQRLRTESFSPDLRIALIGSNDLLLPVYSADAKAQSHDLDSLYHGFTQLAQNGPLLTTTIAPFRLFDDQIAPVEQKINQVRRALNYRLAQNKFVVDTAPLVANQADDALANTMNFGDGMHLSPRGGTCIANALWPQIQSFLDHN
jgi:lysophospholipase L1-like esterase